MQLGTRLTSNSSLLKPSGTRLCDRSFSSAVVSGRFWNRLPMLSRHAARYCLQTHVAAHEELDWCRLKAPVASRCSPAIIFPSIEATCSPAAGGEFKLLQVLEDVAAGYLRNLALTGPLQLHTSTNVRQATGKR